MNPGYPSIFNNNNNSHNNNDDDVDDDDDDDDDDEFVCGNVRTTKQFVSITSESKK